MTGAVATAETEIHATPQRVWAALTDPDQVAAYMDGSRVETTWEVGSPITWTGEYDGHAYQDKGKVLAYDEPHVLSVTHYSPLMGQDDESANYHTVVYTVTVDGGLTRISLTQDNCNDQRQAEQFSRHWQQMLDQVKTHVET